MTLKQTLARLATQHGIDKVRQTIEEIDAGKVMGVQVLLDDELASDEWKLVPPPPKANVTKYNSPFIGLLFPVDDNSPNITVANELAG